MKFKIIVKLPLTKTGRKYGYIMWKKRNDDEIKNLFDGKKSIDLKFTSILQKKKNIDWKRRRIGITYRLTRSIAKEFTCLKLYRIGDNLVKVAYE